MELGQLLPIWSIVPFVGMLLSIAIFPLAKGEWWESHELHVIIFFIFMVANMGGCLTPLGDPPLFLGYLRGVPFFWTLVHIWPILLLNMLLLCIAFVGIDRHFIKLEGPEGRDALELMDAADERTPIYLDGAHNCAFLALIIVAVILNGTIPKIEAFIDPATGKTFGFDVFGVHVGIDYITQIGLILIALALSWITTPKAIRKRNNFEWAPITEVAKLFIGIFITMIPALALLRSHGGSIGIDTPLEFFWATGLLSSFLDNSPTYVVFLTAAGAIETLAPAMVVTSVGVVGTHTLLAISAGAVFMGALTYIGNAPNFMVKSIAERGNVNMPSFFGYMGWSLAILLPIFMIDTVVFFL